MKHTLTCNKHILAVSVLSAIAASTTNAFAEEMPAEPRDGEVIEEIQVIGRSVSYANNATDENMKQQQTAMTSVLATIDNLPGVLINETGLNSWAPIKLQCAKLFRHVAN